jgi:DNA-binding LytR/AlgR family response regulator
MPGPINGLDLARNVRTLHPRVPVLLTTGYSDAARDAAAIGTAILLKPYTLATLDTALRRCLAGTLAASRATGSGRRETPPR